MNLIQCLSCKKVILEKDLRRKTPVLKPVNGAVLTEGSNVAPRVKCSCGRVHLHMEASV